ncbi:hypothetical protein BV898_18569 [Hypsibius exemplaris]|uniref:Uncharacterized protein n=1 Tax=Hypsibius exemplaris TaxID=2072580 RepID=A0A9X6RN97_HYPEX|nr:hypothetical protein BV898_18569 [Hypsibius exemplaris]
MIAAEMMMTSKVQLKSMLVRQIITKVPRRTRPADAISFGIPLDVSVDEPPGDWVGTGTSGATPVLQLLVVQIAAPMALATPAL